MHNKLKKDQSFSWTDDVKNYFVRIKKAISSASIMENHTLRNILSYTRMPLRKSFLLFSYNMMTIIMKKL
jgi:hypothetical protein